MVMSVKREIVGSSIVNDARFEGLDEIAGHAESIIFGPDQYRDIVMSSKIRLKSVHEAPAQDDGKRILVDRLWPRGVTKERLSLDWWAKAVAPSSALRKWYSHDPEKWNEFQARYTAELDANPEGVAELLEHMGIGAVTFLFGSKEARLNNATVLRDYVSQRR